MSKAAAWATAIAVTVVVAALLLFLASMRYPIALVDPPLPVPDYTLQAGIAFTGCALAVAACVATGLVAGKTTRRRGHPVVVGSTVIVGIGVIATIAALTLSTL